jgi:hypothetical protein
MRGGGPCLAPRVHTAIVMPFVHEHAPGEHTPFGMRVKVTTVSGHARSFHMRGSKAVGMMGRAVHIETDRGRR